MPEIIIPYYHSPDYRRNAVYNYKSHPISTVDRTALGLTLTSDDEGLEVFDKDQDKNYHWDGAAWTTTVVPPVFPIVNSIIQDGTNITWTRNTLLERLTPILSNLTGFTSDNLTEGSTNLYYKDSRVQTFGDSRYALLSSSIPNSFIQLTDAPSSYTGQSSKIVAVNVSETGVIFKTLTKFDVGLGNVDNTSDANKPISTATQTALNLKADAATTIVGYHISDAYTKTQIDNFFSGGVAISGYNKANWDEVYTWQQAISGQRIVGRYAASPGVAQEISIGTGLGLNSGTGVLALATSGVSAGTYGSSSLIPILAIDIYGRITSASTTALSLSSYVLKSGDTMSGNLLMSGGAAIDSVLTGGTDTLNIGTANADVINIGWAGATLNLVGTRVWNNTTDLAITDKLIRLNVGGGASSGVSTGFEIEEGGSATGYFSTDGTRTGWLFKSPGSQELTLGLDLLTTSRTIKAPNQSGTIALVSDLLGVVTSITGTTNQVIASASTGAVTLSLPQSIATTSSPTFANLNLSSLSQDNSSGEILYYNDSTGEVTWEFANFIAGVTGTPFRIDVSFIGGGFENVDISTSYVGQPSITTVGTLTTGTIGAGFTAIANARLANSSVTVQGVPISLGSSGNIINGTGFVKATGTTISYDNSTYLTTASAASTYAPITGSANYIQNTTSPQSSSNFNISTNGVVGGTLQVVGYTSFGDNHSLATNAVLGCGTTKSVVSGTQEYIIEMSAVYSKTGAAYDKYVVGISNHVAVGATNTSNWSGDGVHDTVIGMSSQIDGQTGGTGTILSAVSYRAVGSFFGGNTWTTYKGLDIAMVKFDTAVITNAYGIYVGTMGAATNKWSIYTVDGLAYIGGTLQINGSTTLGSAGLITTGSTSGNVTIKSTTGTWTFNLPTSAGTNTYVLQTDGSGNTSWVPPSATSAALTKTDDTNVTLTLGGTPASALLAATSLTLGWTGTLSIVRGGTGLSSTSQNFAFIGPTSGSGAPTWRALVAGDIPSLSSVYLKLDGTSTMAGALVMGSNNITGAGIISGGVGTHSAASGTQLNINASSGTISQISFNTANTVRSLLYWDSADLSMNFNVNGTLAQTFYSSRINISGAAGSNTASSGPGIQLTSNTVVRAYLQQLNASNGVDFWFFNSSWGKQATMTATGDFSINGGMTGGTAAFTSGTFSSTLTVTGNTGLGSNSALGRLEVRQDSSVISPITSVPAQMYITNGDTTTNNYACLAFADSNGSPNYARIMAQFKNHAGQVTDLVFYPSNGALLETLRLSGTLATFSTAGTFSTGSGTQLIVNATSGQFTQMDFKNASTTKASLIWDNSDTSLNMSVGPAAQALSVYGSTFGGITYGRVVINATGGSNTVGAAAGFQLSAGSRGFIQQMNASNGIDYWFLNVSWAKVGTMTATGDLSVNGSVSGGAGSFSTGVFSSTLNATGLTTISSGTPVQTNLGLQVFAASTAATQRTCAEFNMTTATASGNAIGIFISSASISTGTISQIQGINSCPGLTAAGTVTVASAFKTSSNISAGTVGTYVGFYAGAITPTGSGAITTKYSFYAEAGSGTALFSDGGSFSAPLGLPGYTVATLPAGSIGQIAYVTDALTPSFLVVVVGGGSTKSPVFHNGTNWVVF